MARRRVCEERRNGIEDADESGHEAVGIFGFERPVGGVEQHHRIGIDLRDAANDLSHVRHRDRGVESRSAHIADREHDAAVGEQQRVVPIAADLRFVHSRAIERTERQAGNVRQRSRQRRFLEALRHAALLLVRVRDVAQLQRETPRARHAFDARAHFDLLERAQDARRRRRARSPRVMKVIAAPIAQQQHGHQKRILRQPLRASSLSA